LIVSIACISLLISLQYMPKNDNKMFKLDRLLLQPYNCKVYGRVTYNTNVYSTEDDVKILIKNKKKLCYSYGKIIFFIPITDSIKVIIRWYYNKTDMLRSLKIEIKCNELLLSDHYDIIDIRTISRILKISSNTTDFVYCYRSYNQIKKKINDSLNYVSVNDKRLTYWKLIQHLFIGGYK
jgi:hypothetical protein